MLERSSNARTLFDSLCTECDCVSCRCDEVAPEPVRNGEEAEEGNPARKYPLVMAYVPVQRFEPLYESDTALMHGTVFPSLDLPFLGKRASEQRGEEKSARQNLLMRVARASFALDDLHLFTDTHPTCAHAKQKAEEAEEAESRATAEFERRFGPLTAAAAAGQDAEKWVGQAWPWEMEG